MKNKKIQMATLKKVLSYIKKYTLHIIASIVLACIIVALTLYVPILIGKAIDGIVYGQVDFKSI